MHSQTDKAAVCKRASSPILWAGLGVVCFMLSSPACAAAAPADSAAAPANFAAAASGGAQVRDTRLKSERSGDLRPTQRGAQPTAGSTARNSTAVAPRRGLVTPQSTLVRPHSTFVTPHSFVTPHRAFVTPQNGVSQGVGVGADRVGALRSTQAQSRPGPQTSQPFGANRAATGVPGLDGPGVSKPNALLPKTTAMTRNSAIGGAREQSLGRLDGAAVGRTNHSAAIDGSQFRRKL
jgi:hypothetical protein